METLNPKIKGRVIFDHLTLNQIDRELISKACNFSSKVFLASLDKGLSGSKVYLAKWKLNNRNVSKYHVFKIGKYEKLKKEEDAIKNVASVVQSSFAQANLFPHENSIDALLRQEFKGGDMGEGKSLRLYIQEINDINRIRSIINNLYCKKLYEWNQTERLDEEEDEPVKKIKIKDALDWWLSKEDIEKASTEIGKSQIEFRIKKLFELSITDIKNILNEIKEIEVDDDPGIVHGDLHSQNVIIDKSDKIHLIDFGWTGIKWRLVDFLMMECSLKYLVSPPHSPMDGLLKIDQLLDSNWGNTDFSVFNDLSDFIHGSDLIKIASSIHEVRLCALKLSVVKSIKEYRIGLIPFIAALASIPTQINRVFLFHSLAYHIKEYKNDK
jgi:serine/threonine protein kinase